MPDREARLQTVKDLSARNMLADAQHATRLASAAYSGSGLGVSSPRLRQPPYPPAVSSALALAALAVLDGAGENARANTDALQYDRASQDCFASSKLNLFQCLAASRPSYELEFCLGRHIVRDLSTCARGTALPATLITVDAPRQSRAEAASPPAAARPQAATPLSAPATAPSASTPPLPVTRQGPALASDASQTQRLNAAPPSGQN